MGLANEGSSRPAMMIGTPMRNTHFPTRCFGKWTDQTDPNGSGTQRFANIDHCVTLVVQLMMQARKSPGQKDKFRETANWVWVKIKPPGTACFSHGFHVPGFDLGYPFLTQRQLFREFLGHLQ